jgi:hypothetical protein
MNLYFPTEDDIRSWAYGSAKRWPAADWDYYVLDQANDDLVFELANDPNCPNREFFVHALYYLVGSTFNKKEPPADKLSRIERLIGKVGSSSMADVVNWKDKVGQLLRHEIPFDVEMWLHHMFNDQNEP